MSESLEIPVYFNTWATFLARNLHLNKHDHLTFCLPNRVYNDPQCVLLCNSPFFEEYLTLSTYSTVIAMYCLILLVIQLLLCLHFIVTHLIACFHLRTIQLLFIKPLVASDPIIEHPLQQLNGSILNMLL